MKVSLRRPAPVTTTAAVAEESAKPRQGALGWALGVLLRALVVVAVVLWLWPPRPRDPAPLPVDWTPGCPKLQAEWRALQPQHGVIRHPVPTHVGSDAAIFGVAGGSGARLVRVSAAGSEDVLHGPYGPLREPAAVAGSLWAIEESPGRTGLVEVDPATCRVRRSWHYPPRDEPPLQSRLAPEHRTPLELPDGSLAVVVRVDATKAAWIVVGYNPTTGAFGITRLDEEIKEHTQFATHPPNLLLTRSWRDGPGTKAIDLATGRVVPTPEGVEIPRMVAPYDRRLAVLTKAAPGHGEGALIGGGLRARLSRLRRMIWALTIGPERAAAALARTHRVASVVVPPEGRRGRIEEEAIVGGDLALTTDTTTVCTARFRLLSRNPLETDMSDLRIHATTALWTMPLADGRFLVLQGVDRVPPAVNTGEPLLRIGVLDPATRAVAWHGWLPLPAGTAPTRLLPGAGASAGRMMIGLVEGVAKRGGTEVGPNAWWCEFPAPEGVAFPPPPGRSQYAFHAHEYR